VTSAAAGPGRLGHRIAVCALTVLIAVAVAPETRAAVTPITTCGQTVTTSAVLTVNLGCPGAGIVVGASGITIDLNGHSIVGTNQDATGIENDGFDGVKVINGTVNHFKWGILIGSDADRNTVQNVTVRGNTLDGLNAGTGSDLLTISNVRAIANGAIGISLSDSTGHKVDKAYATQNSASGIKLINTPGTKLTNSTATFNLADGILVQLNTAGLSVSNTVVAGNTWDGLRLEAGVVGARIAAVTAVDNGLNGIVLAGADGALIQKVVASGNPLDGVQDQAAGMHLTNSTLTGNGIGVAVCSGCPGVMVGKTKAIGNGTGFGINDVTAVIAGSVADGNTGFGIEAVAPANDGGKNTAHGNGILDCANVVCG
jgi:hypothetical protein